MIVIGAFILPTLAFSQQSAEYHRQWNPQHQGYDGNRTTSSAPVSRGWYKKYPNSWFVWDWQDGTHWYGYNSVTQDPVFQQLANCGQEAKQKYGENTCAMHKKNGKKKMVVALGYDNQAQRWWAVSNNGTKTNGDPKKILKECQDKGYVDCQIVWNGSH